LRALQQTHGNQYVMRLMQQTQGSVVQRKIAGKTTLSQIENAIRTNLTAFYIYQNSPNLRNTIDEKLKETDDYTFYKNASNPLELETAKKKGYSELSNDDAIAKWVLNVYFNFTGAKSDTGYGDDHSAQLSKTEKPTANWVKFIQTHLSLLPLNLTVNRLVNPYKKLYDDAIQAAKQLDMGEASGNTIKTDLTAEFKAIQDFADFVDLNRDTTATKVKSQIPKWQTESKFGSGVGLHAEFVPYGTMARGSGIDITTPIDWFYSGRTDGSSARYVKGHLLNDHVGGPAKNYNLAPLHEQANHQHENMIESELKGAVAIMQHQARNNVSNFTYDRVIYDVNLGKQSARTHTQTWRTAADFLQACAEKNATVDDILNKKTVGLVDFSTAPPAITDIINSININKHLKISQLINIFNFSALLWELEDYLVRDWYVRLQLIQGDGNIKITRLKLDNPKPKELNTEFKVVTATGTAGNKWQPEAPKAKSPPPLSETEEFDPKHPLRLEHQLAAMSRNEYELFQWWATDTLLVPKPPDYAPNLDLRTYATTNKDALAVLLKGFNFQEINHRRQSRAQQERLSSFSMGMQFGKMQPEEQFQFGKSLDSSISNKEETQSFIHSKLGIMNSPLRQENLSSLEDQFIRFERRNAPKKKKEQEQQLDLKEENQVLQGRLDGVKQADQGYKDGYQTGYLGRDAKSKEQLDIALQSQFIVGSDAYQRGFKEGFTEYYLQSYKTGYTQGLEVGTREYQQGLARGKEQGYSDGYGTKFYNDFSKPYSHPYDLGYKNGYHNGYSSGEKKRADELGYRNGLSDAKARNTFNDATFGTTNYQQHYQAAYKRGFDQGMYDRGYNTGYYYGKQDGRNDEAYDETINNPHPEYVRGYGEGYFKGFRQGLKQIRNLY
jgi:hypothetical protein